MYKLIFCITFLSLLIEGFDIYHSQASKQLTQNQETSVFNLNPKRRQANSSHEVQDNSEISINGSILKLDIQQQIITINLLDYKFYEIKCGDGFSYNGLSADCLSNKRTSNFIPIKILFQTGNNCYLLNVSILDIYNKHIYSRNISISNSQFDKLNINVSVPNDITRQNILNQESYFYNFPIISNTPKNKIKKTGSFDFEDNPQPSTPTFEELAEQLTCTDEILDNFDIKYSRILDDTGHIKGNHIVDLIPELCFTNIGEYCYVGKEYGFAVQTIFDGESITGETKHQSFVTIFDIEITLPGDKDINKTEFDITIIPKLFYIFKHDECSDVNSYYWTSHGFSTEATSIIYEYSDAVFGGLSNIHFMVSVENANELNYGDPEYIAENDNGDFIIQTRYNYFGASRVYNDSRQYGIDVADAILSHIPIIKDVKSIVSDVKNGVDLITDFWDLFGYTGVENSKFHLTSDFYSNNEINITPAYTDAMTQIDEYGGLAKTCFIYLTSQFNGDIKNNIGQSTISFVDSFAENNNDDSKLEEYRHDLQDIYNPILFKNEEHYVEGKVVFNHANNNLPSNETKLTYGIYFDVCNQLTHPFFGDAFPGDLVTVMSCMGYNAPLNTYQRTQTKVEDYEEFSINYISGETIRFRYKSEETKKYAIMYNISTNALLKIYINEELEKQVNLMSSKSYEFINEIEFQKDNDYYFEINEINNYGNLSLTIIDQIDGTADTTYVENIIMQKKYYFYALFTKYASLDKFIMPTSIINFKLTNNSPYDVSMILFDKNKDEIERGTSFTYTIGKAKVNDLIGYVLLVNEDDYYPLDLTLKIYNASVKLIEGGEVLNPIIPSI